MIEEAIEQYENNIINSARLIERLVEIAREIKAAEKEGETLGLSQEELSFYDTLARGKKELAKSELQSLAKEIVKTIKRDITIDWSDHEIIKARVRANVRFVLLRHKVEFDDLEPLTEKIYEQAESIYKNYPSL
jgi:type I restriction enzyme R subunit